MALEFGGGSWGVAFLIGVLTVAELIAKACSSPQTVEVNAGRRAETAFKWVKLGLAEGAVVIMIAVIVDKKWRTPILLGALTEIAITWAEYSHAKKAGLASPQPGTEN